MRSRSAWVAMCSPGCACERRHERSRRRLRRNGQLQGCLRPCAEHVSLGGGVIRADQTECRDHSMRRCRADPDHQLQQAEPRDHVVRVVREPERREHVLDVRRFDEAQAAVFHEGNPAHPQLELEQSRMVRRTDKHRLLVQGNPGFAVRQDTIADRVGLRVLVCAAHELRAGTRRRPCRLQHRREPDGRIRSNGIGDVEDLLARAIVGLQNHGRRRRKHLIELENVARLRGAERVQRLRIVADHRDARVIAPQRGEDVHLEAVDVLVLVHEHVIERARETRTETIVLRRRPPEEQQIVEVHEPRRSLPLHVAPADRRDLVDALLRPGRDLGDHRRQRAARVYRRRIQVDEQGLARKAPACRGWHDPARREPCR